MKTVLVTGAAGFLGKAICANLAERGYKVIPIEGSKNFAQKVDIASKEDIDIVIHAGFTVDFSDREKEKNFNRKNSLYLSEKLRNKEAHFLFLSAAAALGVSSQEHSRAEDDFDTCDTEFSSMQKSNYVKDKIAVEKILSNQQKRFTVLYLTTVYGSGMPKDTLKAIRMSGMLPFQFVPPGGTSYLMLDDFLRFLRLAIEKPLFGRYLLNSGNLTYRALFQKVIEFSGRKKILLPLPKFISRFVSFLPIKGGFLASLAVIQSSFGFKYYTPAKALRETIWRPQKTIDQFFEEILR
jgi:nucleoside-diphosphate-sugar epimerase